MSKIKIRNFGPITEGFQDNDGWLNINKVMVFIGSQGSGKSTVAKLISTFTWIEKALVSEKYDKKWFERKGINRFKSRFLTYHRLDAYLNSNSVIEYQGEAYSIIYQNESLVINEIASKSYSLPQIMYVPAERNLLTYVRGAKELILSSEALGEFSIEYSNALKEMKDVMQLPINNAAIEYDKLNETLNLKGENYKVKITDASSGFQSFVPLYLVSEYLANSVKKHSESKESMSGEERIRYTKGVQDIWNNDSLTDEQRRIAFSVLSARFNKNSFINIVEEPEQNLFPSSQWKMLQSLLALNNMNDENRLILTTHSPYLISYLTIAIKAKQVLDNFPQAQNEILNIISLNSCVNAENVTICEIEENTGIIKLLPKYNGIIPSDDNFLNNMLIETNTLFEKLQEIEEEYEN